MLPPKEHKIKAFRLTCNQLTMIDLIRKRQVFLRIVRRNPMIQSEIMRNIRVIIIMNLLWCFYSMNSKGDLSRSRKDYK
jgi:hypothetical protein